MADFPKIILRNSKVDAVKRFHPWIFSGAIKQIDPQVQEGAIADVYSEKGEYLATGHYNNGNIAVKVLSFQPIETIEQTFLEKFKNAYELRQTVGLATSSTTNCYRLINAEGDGLPGLIVDWYNGTAVMQAYSLGMYEQRSLLVDCLKTVYGDRLHTVYDKSGSVLGKTPQRVANQFLLGEKPEGLVRENGHEFLVNWEEGQKTGFFLDQRDNRALLAQYVQNKRVLNTFCYSGGFSVYAIAAQAALVDSVDSSQKAIDWTNHNVELNNPNHVSHRAIATDVFEFLKESDRYDVIVLDPPAFAKNISARHQAMMAYRRLNRMAIDKLNSGGLLFTFSCSQVVDTENFRGAVTAGAIEAGRGIRVLHSLTQPADHPVSIFHPEGRYLKGLVLAVD